LKFLVHENEVGNSVTRAKAQRRQEQKIRSTKLETNSKRGKIKQLQCSKQKGSNSAFWIFFGFGFIWLRFVSNFDIRISDFPWLASRRDTCVEVVALNIKPARI
jgi:hypothetical protein